MKNVNEMVLICKKLMFNIFIFEICLGTSWLYVLTYGIMKLTVDMEEMAFAESLLSPSEN